MTGKTDCQGGPSGPPFFVAAVRPDLQIHVGPGLYAPADK